MLGKRKAERDKSKYLSYSDLRKYVRSKGIRSKDQYIKHLSNNFEYNGMYLAYNPSTFYTKDIWEGWSIFLRDEVYKKNYNGTYYTYTECKEVIKKYKFTGKAHFLKDIATLIKNNIRIPYSPSTIYKKEWEGWALFLNTDNITDQIKNLVSFEEARIWARTLNLKLFMQWYDIKFEDMPIGMTKKPNILYKNSGWIDWYDFLGINKKTKMSYGEILIADYLYSIDVKYNFDKSLKDCNSRLRFDFYLPDYNTCIEFDGIQHFQSVSVFGGDEEFEKTKIRDVIKNEWCKLNNINIIRFRYDDSKDYILDKLNNFK